MKKKLHANEIINCLYNVSGGSKILIRLKGTIECCKWCCSSICQYVHNYVSVGLLVLTKSLFIRGSSKSPVMRCITFFVLNAPMLQSLHRNTRCMG